MSKSFYVHWKRMDASLSRRDRSELDRQIQLDVFQEKFGSVDNERLTIAVRICIDETKWFPTPCEFQEFVDRAKPKTLAITNETQCPACDNGFRFVVHPATIEKVKNGKYARRHFNTCNVPCDQCAVGISKSEPRQLNDGSTKPGLPLFNSSRMIESPSFATDEIENMMSKLYGVKHD